MCHTTCLYASSSGFRPNWLVNAGFAPASSSSWADSEVGGTVTYGRGFSWSEIEISIRVGDGGGCDGAKHPDPPRMQPSAAHYRPPRRCSLSHQPLEGVRVRIVMVEIHVVEVEVW